MSVGAKTAVHTGLDESETFSNNVAAHPSFHKLIKSDTRYFHPGVKAQSESVIKPPGPVTGKNSVHRVPSS